MTHKEFVSYFPEDLFIPNLVATDKAAALEILVNHLVEKKRIKNGKVVLEALKKRESLGSTGIGKNLAIPHGRTTVTSALTVVYARSVDGIRWDSLDGKPARLRLDGARVLHAFASPAGDDLAPPPQRDPAR